MRETNSLVVFLMREFGWTLEYTVGLVKTLPVKKLNALITEIQYQKAIEDYKVASNFAMIIANWASAQGKRRYKVSDFIGKPPEPRQVEPQPSLEDVAKQAGILMPEGGIND